MKCFHNTVYPLTVFIIYHTKRRQKLEVHVASRIYITIAFANFNVYACVWPTVISYGIP